MSTSTRSTAALMLFRSSANTNHYGGSRMRRAFGFLGLA